MASTASATTPRGPQPPSSSSKLPKNPNPPNPPPPPLDHPQNANPNPLPDASSSSPSAAASNPLAPPPGMVALSRASHCTRLEVLRLRSHRLKQLSRCYRDHYWALMEELKVQYRDYYWEYGVSPFRDLPHASDPNPNPPPDLDYSGDDPHHSHHHINGSSVAGSSCKGGGDIVEARSNNPRCAFVSCKYKAMALTSFCLLHILSDSKQKLYKPCTHVIKNAQAGPITCGKPILRSTVPSLCASHFHKAQKYVTQALKKAGLTGPSSSKLAPKFHVIVAEFVRQVQAKRRAARDATEVRVVVKEEATS